MSTATLNVKGHRYELPLVEGTEGELGLDVSALRSQSMAITLDPGYGNTGSCRSAITFINGEKGILRYRGYPIEELATQRASRRRSGAVREEARSIHVGGRFRRGRPTRDHVWIFSKREYRGRAHVWICRKRDLQCEFTSAFAAAVISSVSSRLRPPQT